MSPHPKHAHHLHHSRTHRTGHTEHPAHHPSHPHHKRVIVVDHEDNVVGHKSWGKLEPGDIHRASFLWVTNPKGQVLLSKRSRHVHNPGVWTAAASGTVMEDETYEQNMYSEAEEEIGLTGVSFYLGPKILVELPQEGIYIQWFVAMLDRRPHDFKLGKTEVDEVRWINRDRFQSEVAAHPELYSPAVPHWRHLWA
jgi:isopentenyldiphosphate isomerase